MSMMDNAEALVTEFNRAYDENTELEKICTRRHYGDGGGSSGIQVENDDSLKYYQIGRRTHIPVSHVEEGRFRYVSETAADALAEGEKKFFAESLEDATGTDGSVTHTADPSSLVPKGRDIVGEPNLVLVPRSQKYDGLVKGWREKGSVRRFGEDDYYVGGEDEDLDCWLYRFNGSGGVFVVDTERVSVVQKDGEDTLSPTGFRYNGGAEHLNDGNSVSVYFGEERHEGNGEYGEFFDLLYRVVLSEPVVEEDGFCKVVLK